MKSFEPIPSQERLPTLDVLRGAALLGILLMNILVFGMPFAAYQNPNLWGGNDPVNLGGSSPCSGSCSRARCGALFSMMFGAGIVVFMDRALARDNTVSAADLYCRRMLWLMLFGALHGWLIWHGDILYAYALCGLMIFPLRNASPRALFVTGGCGAPDRRRCSRPRVGLQRRSVRNAAVAARAVEAQGGTLTEEQREAKEAWDQAYNGFLPSREKLQAEVDDYRNGYVSAFDQRAKIMRKFNFIPAYSPRPRRHVGHDAHRDGALQGWRAPGLSPARLLHSAGDHRIWHRYRGERALRLRDDRLKPRSFAAWLWTCPVTWGACRLPLRHAAVLVMLVQQGRLDLAHQPPRRCRPDGVLELHRNVDNLRPDLLLARTRAHGPASAVSAVLRRVRHVDFQRRLE